MTVRVRTEYDDDGLRKELAKIVRNWVAQSALEVRKQMTTQLSRPGRGRQHAGQRRRSSAPGDPPALQTGQLRRSIDVDFSRLNDKVPRARVGTNVPYGRYLEYGVGPFTIKAKGKSLVAGKGKDAVFFGKTVRHPGIKPRPWARPALHKAIPRIRRRMTHLPLRIRRGPGAF